jgi:hypothetical protein
MDFKLPATAETTARMIEGANISYTIPGLAPSDWTRIVFDQAVKDGIAPSVVGKIVAHLFGQQLRQRLDPC